MQKKHVEELLHAVAGGTMTPESALARLALEPVQDTLNGLALDTQRELRTNLGEVVFAPGKSDSALLGAVRGLSAPAARSAAASRSRCNPAPFAPSSSRL